MRMRLHILMPSILRAAFFAATLAAVGLYGGFFWTVLFFCAAFYGYFRSLFEWNTFLYSFCILTLYSVLGMSFLSHASETSGFSGTMPNVVVAFLFGVLFFLLLSIKEFLFLRRQAIFNFLSGSLYFFIGGAFFLADKNGAGAYLTYSILSFVALYLLIKESTEFFMEDAPKRKKELLVIGSAVLVVEFLSVVSILPIGFLNSAALIILFAFILEDLVYYHLKGTLDRQIVLNNVTILIVCLLFIFATSKLSL